MRECDGITPAAVDSLAPAERDEPRGEARDLEEVARVDEVRPSEDFDHEGL
jgi:hypothetical protein